MYTYLSISLSLYMPQTEVAQACREWLSLCLRCPGAVVILAARSGNEVGCLTIFSALVRRSSDKIGNDLSGSVLRAPQLPLRGLRLGQ